MRLDVPVLRSKVGRRTFLLFIACALFPVSAVAILAFGHVATQLEEQRRSQLHQAAKATGMAIYERLLLLEAALKITASRLSTGADSAVWTPEADEDLTRRFLGLVLMTGGGRLQLSGQVETVFELTATEKLHLSSGRTLLTSIHRPGLPSRIFMSRAVDPRRPDRGVLAGEIDTAYLWGVGDEHTLPPMTELCVLDRSGALLFCSWPPAVAFPEKLAHQIARVASGQFEWRHDGSTYVASYWSLFLQFAFLQPKWTVVLNQSKADVLAPMARFTRTFPLVVLTSLCLVVLLSMSQIRRRLVPLERLQDGARRIATMDFDARVDVTSGDEYEELARSFNGMAGQLGSQFKSLTTMTEISIALNHGDKLSDILQQCAQTLARRFDLAFVAIWTLNGEQNGLELEASAGPAAPPNDAQRHLPLGPSAVGLIAQERRPQYTNSVLEDPRGTDKAWARREGVVAYVGHPLLIEQRLVGVVAAFARTPIDQVIRSGFVAVAEEIARCIERKRVEEALRGSEEQVRQLQKMEAVGRLAGGIAHDFNNLLMVITGRSQLLLRQLASDDPLRPGIKLIDDTAGRAAWLTKQLLAFSRKQVLAPAVLDLNEVVEGMATMLRRLIGEHIDLAFCPESELCRVKVDRGQLEQVVMNLVVNARDAMPQGGCVTLETANVELGETYARHHVDVRPGAYVVLAVTDTGIGMDRETRSRIFEPFFTTKGPGKGTGLGLATVYGIVRQSGGHIEVVSEPGKGSTFKVYLPRVRAALEPVEATNPEVAPGTETVLLVEDEDQVRALAKEILEAYGYGVLHAARVDEAVRFAEHHRGPIHLLVTDVVMPQMSGVELAWRLAPLRPEMKVLYMSGYADEAFVQHSRLEPGTLFLQKPFTPDALVRRVRELLDAPDGDGVAKQYRPGRTPDPVRSPNAS